MITFVEDSSNRSPEMLRNRIRTELIPMLERDYAPGLRGRLVEIAGEMRSVDDFMNAAVEDLEWWTRGGSDYPDGVALTLAVRRAAGAGTGAR